MLLLEREHQLALLTQAYGSALRGEGRLCLVHGEAGAGKTTLVQRFLGALPAATTRYVAGCESLFTVRPFGPIVDLADALPSALTAALREPDRYQALFPDFLGFLRKSPHPKVLVIEDLHWADEGTLDLVRYLGRRLGGVPALFLTTHRDDGLALDHPLRRLLGELPSTTTLRIAVPCLSREGVARLAGQARRHETGLYEMTGGNPFFVTELLSHRDGDMPPSVKDATLGRLRLLGPEARALAELAAVSPGSIERSLIVALIADANAAIDECVETGLLNADAGSLRYRHELARQAIERALGPGRRVDLHRRLFDALQRHRHDSDMLPRLVHHAHAAELRDEVLALAPQAARIAAQSSSHREAALHYALALRHAVGLDLQTHADLLERAAEEHRLIGDIGAAIDACREALSLRERAGDRIAQGMNLRRLAAVLRECGATAEAGAAIDRAVELLEGVPPSLDLVHAYAEQSRLRLLDDYPTAVGIGERALGLAEGFGDPLALVEALQACMTAKMYLRDDREARRQLERALAMALEHGLEEVVAQLFAALQLVSVIHRDHAYALEIAQRGLAYCQARDLDVLMYRLRDNRALSLVELGRWDEADLDIDECLAAPNVPERLRNSLMLQRARQRSRRGLDDDPGYWLALQHDMDAGSIGFRQAAVAAACAEAAWLRGDAQTMRLVAASGICHATRKGDARLLGPPLVWARRCGAPIPATSLEIAPMFAAELAGDIEAAAAHWAALGCRYDRALALVHGDAAQIERALHEFEALGARAAAEIARQRLRAHGVRAIRRGPQPRTQADPFGLTARERQVYTLLCQALSNAEIARRLHRSERTVESHVSAVFAKLGVSSRAELVQAHGSLRASAPE